MDLNDIAACGDIIEHFINIYLDGNLFQTFLPPTISIIGFGSDSLSMEGSFQELLMGMEFNGITTAGTYDNTNIGSALYSLENTAGQTLFNSCFNNCAYDLLEFTFIGNVGEDIEGYWEGTDIEFDNFSTGNTEIYDVRVEFDLLRD